MSFIKESIKEFDHVVWPTPTETRKYFVTVVTMITVLTILLFAIGTAFSVGLFTAKNQFVPVSTITPSASETPVGDLKLDNIETTAVPADSTIPETE